MTVPPLADGDGETGKILGAIGPQPDGAVADVDETRPGCVAIEQGGQAVPGDEGERHPGAQRDGQVGGRRAELPKHVHVPFASMRQPARTQPDDQRRKRDDDRNPSPHDAAVDGQNPSDDGKGQCGRYHHDRAQRVAEARQGRAGGIGVGACCRRRENSIGSHGRFAFWTSCASSASRMRSHANHTHIAITHAVPAIAHGDRRLSRSISRAFERSVTNPGCATGRN